MIDHFAWLRSSGVDHHRLALVCVCRLLGLLGWFIVIFAWTLCGFSGVLPEILEAVIWIRVINDRWNANSRDFELVLVLSEQDSV